MIAVARNPASTYEPGEPVTGLETLPAPLELLPAKRGLSLYWHTFWVLVSMVACAVIVCAVVAFFVFHVEPAARLDWTLAVGLLAGGFALSLASGAIGARLLNRPIRDLSFAASRVLGGKMDSSRLDEHAATPEIREMNLGFNRMADQLAQVDQDRATMLAGISHDLRTPLARLRLETEISVADEIAREHMAADIEQLDRTIDKFLDYARPEHPQHGRICLNDVIDAALDAVRPYTDLKVTKHVREEIDVLGDEVDLARVLANLLENARRYGKAKGEAVAHVEIIVKPRDHTVGVLVRDHGPGVPPSSLSQLTKPFFRGDTARTAATGAGLGLAIVEKALHRMGGTFRLSNAPEGGLVAHLRLVRAKEAA